MYDRLDTLVASMTQVHVGTGEVENFVIRKDLAIPHSQLFAKALDPTAIWKEAQENIVPLPEVKPENFQVFPTFLNTRSIQMCHFEPAGELKRKEGEDRAVGNENGWESLVAQTWLLSDQLTSTSFKGAIVDKVASLVAVESKIPKTMHRTIYANSIRYCGMQKLLVDLATYRWNHQDLETLPADPECAEFFRDVAMKSKKMCAGLLPKYATFDRVNRHYHDHGGEPCYNTIFS